MPIARQGHRHAGLRDEVIAIRRLRDEVIVRDAGAAVCGRSSERMQCVIRRDDENGA